MPPKRVAIIGAGAAGMSCASTLAKHPEFAVTLIDIESHTGGQATSITLDESTHGASWLNDGVQGGSQIFRHTFQFFRRYGYEPQPVKLQVAFGKGKDFWTNVFPSPLVDEHSTEIKKLSWVLSCIKYLMPVFGIMPVKVILRLFRFSDDFSNKMVLPLLALFLGTGNQTPNVSSVLLERLFNDPQMKLWEYDPDTLLPNLPTMYTSPNLSSFYRDWAEDLRAKGVDIHLNCHPRILERGRNGITLELLDHDQNQTPGPPSTEKFDDLVMCCPADEAKRLLDRHATWREKYF
jgi:phytoene dehydrogenase-like protein